MIGPDLVAALDGLLSVHPAVAVSARGHAAHANRYLAANGCPIATEPKRTNTANLWVRADSMRHQHLADIEHQVFENRSFDGASSTITYLESPPSRTATSFAISLKTCGKP